MMTLRLVYMVALATLAAYGQPIFSQQASPQSESAPPASCPVTVRPAHPFTPPAPYTLDGNAFWWGTEKLWTYVSEPAIWEWVPHKPGHEHEVQPLTTKLFWMSINYQHWRAEPHPNLTVTGRRLDGTAPPLLVMPVQNAFQEPGDAMVVGVYVPTPGCWEIAGEYKGEKLSFVVWVWPIKSTEQGSGSLLTKK